MKRYLFMLLTLCLLTPAAMAESWLHKNVVVSLPDPLSWVNMRYAPSTEAAVEAVFFSGVCLSVVEEPAGGWVKVNSQQYSGYIREEYLDLVDGQDVVYPGMPIVTLTRDTRMENGEICPTGTRLLVHGVTADGMLCEVTTGWHYMQIPMSDLSPCVDLTDRHNGVQWTGDIPPYAAGGRIGIVHNPKQGSRLHLRKEKSTSSGSLGKYYSGTVVNVLAEEGDWLHVRIGALEGYMKKEHVFTEESMWHYGDVLQLPTARVSNRTGLNLRAGQSTSSIKLGTYPNGTEVTVLGVSTSWAHVLIGNQDGFMLLDKLSPAFVF